MRVQHSYLVPARSAVGLAASHARVESRGPHGWWKALPRRAESTLSGGEPLWPTLEARAFCH